ncbi:PstS family phosphate ABC transporter substrate-binding protein [Sphingobacterium hungaricum]|uniref:Phosphate ABC transporter n=1 Tax=Sphingobacterium hungaricum TaxID=2082723 RepID=A0A928UWC3_9SPHI|nr:substrate-binding domain-containing protein [Sphingobacterium hungaricum]MBE8714173.1 phosphate ABC transporter [Sphingobacterium hungaricum]
MMRLVNIFFLFAFVFVVACQSSKTEGKAEASDKDDILTGTLNVAVDESVLPLIQEQVDVFHQSYPNSKVNLIPAPEILAINTLLTDKAPIGILTRELSAKENEYFAQRSISPRIFKIGYDGIILVGNKSSADTSIRVSDIVELLNGSTKGSANLIFDNLNSSALRYLKELGNLETVSSKSVQTQKDVDAILNAVVSNPASIGVMSLNQYIDASESFGEKDKIRILSVQNNGEGAKDGLFHKPSQSSLATETYPLSRPIYVLNYQPNTGLGIGFSAFLTGDRGQRIVLKSGLLPASMPGREIIIKDNIN